MMYYYWVEHGIRPSVFYNMSSGEKLVVRSFYEKEMEEKYEKIKGLKDIPIYPVSIV